MNTLDSKIPAVIIEPNFQKIIEVKRILGKLSRLRIAIINMYCFNNNFLEIRSLLKDDTCLKIFHGGSETNFNNMVESLSAKDRKDVKYIKDKLGSKNVAKCYLNYLFQPFTPTVSLHLSSVFEEL